MVSHLLMVSKRTYIKHAGGKTGGLLYGPRIHIVLKFFCKLFQFPIIRSVPQQSNNKQKNYNVF